MERERRGGLVFPILLIAAGIVLLLNTLGIVDWSIWPSLLTLWPIILIAIGLDLLVGRRSTLGSLVVAAIVLVLLGGGIWYLANGTTGAGQLTSHSISQPLAGASRAAMKIKVDTGALALAPLVEGDLLIRGTVMLPTNRSLDEKRTTAGGTAVYTLAATGGTPVLVPQLGSQTGEKWGLQVNHTTPMDLELASGVGEAVVDLETMNLTKLKVNVGVGSGDVILPAQGQLQADVSGGIGSLTLRLPSAMAARIMADSGIGQVEVQGDFQHQGDMYVTPGYDTAANRIALNIHAGIGKIVVEPYEGR
jgi:hypothetical protein